jgi:UDPglucose 6-dehydrogenase
VTLIDTDECKLEDLKSGKLPVREDGLTLESPKISYSSEYKDLDSNIFFVCVGTPDLGDGTQNLTYLKSAFKNIIEYDKSSTIILKSTTLPENVIELSKMLDPIFSKFITNPEFLAEGNAVHDLLNQDQLIIGSDESIRDYAQNLMSMAFEGTFKSIHSVGLCEAMVAKYLLNSYKAMKLTFINEFSSYCYKNEINFSEVLKSIEDPVMGVGFDKPGIGYGGSCFPKDTNAMGTNIGFCRFINDLNECRIREFSEYLCGYLNGIEVKTPKVLLLGKAFKPGTNDTRDSVSIKVGNYLTELIPDAWIYYYDPIEEISDLTLDEVKSNLNRFDLVVMMNHLPEVLESIPEINEHKGFINTRK